MSWHLDGYDAERTFARGVAPGERDSGGERVEDVRHLLEDALGLLP